MTGVSRVSPWSLRRRLAYSAVAIVLSMIVWPERAAAFVCTRVSDTPNRDPLCPPPGSDPYGPSLSWFDRSIPFSLQALGTNDIALDEEMAVLAGSFTAWTQADECRAPQRQTDLEFVELSRSARAFVGFNFLDETLNENLLLFHDDAWPRPGQAGIIALTTTTYNPLTGEIFDGDIEFNAAGNVFTVDDVAPATDLMNTAVHEIGHLLGLAHSAVVDSTMFASAQPGEIKKRDLDCDDRDGVVYKYPALQPNGYCSPAVGECGCCAPPEALASEPTVTVVDFDDGTGCAALTGSGALVSAFTLAVALVLRRRRR